MARTIADRIRHSAKRSFVGRVHELDVLRDAILAEELPFVVAYVHGPGGVGKSRFVLATLEAVSPPAVGVSLDCAQIEPTPNGFLRAVAGALGTDDADPASDSVARTLGRQSARTVLVLDTFETFGLMDAWLRQAFLPLLPETVMTIIASRQPPNPSWLTSPGWEGLFEDIELRNLEPQEAHQILSRRGLSDEQAIRVNGFARGHPLALELAAGALRAQPELEITPGPPPSILGQLSAAFLAGLPSEVAETVEAASTVRRVTEPMLGALLSIPAPRDRFDDLRDLPFVDATGEGLSLHDVVRDTVAADLARRDPERHRRYRRRAWRLLTRESEATGTLNLWQQTADLLFLLQNPHVREAFFPAGSAEVRVEPARPEDGGAVLAIAGDTAPEEMPSLRAWWDRVPGAFSAVRDAGGEVVGFHILCEAGDADPQLANEDPLAAAWFEHLRREPVSEGELVLFYRRWLGASVGEGPSPVQGASFLDIKRSYMEMRPNLRRVYMAMEDPDIFSPALAALGIRHRSEADVEVGGTILHTFVLDFGAASVDGWLQRLVGAELGAGIDEDEVGGTIPEGTVTIMFADIADSTGLTERVGDERFRSLARALDGSVREVIGETGGVPIEGRLLGDGLMAVFPLAHQAVECAVRTNQAAAETGLGLHVGLHAGDVIREDGNVFGGAVNIAARVAAAAPPGEVLVSETVRSLARTSTTVIFESRGHHDLKGVEDSYPLYAVTGRR